MSQDITNSTPVVQSRRGLRIAMFVVLAVLLGLLAARPVAFRIGRAWSRGVEEGKADVARNELQNVNIQEFAAASRNVAKAVGPSVVSIDTVQASGQERFSDERQFYSGPHQQRDGELRGQGSGVIVDQEGHILTNYHVVVGASSIDVHLNGDASRYPAKLVGVDPKKDLALLQVNQDFLMPLRPIPWGESNKIEVGDPVWAVGSPFGLENSVTFGIISGKERRNLGGSSQTFLQTSAAINPGNSGGALVNMRGELVGINTAIVAAPNMGIGFAIPSDTAHAVYERLKKERPGRAPVGYLGVKLGPLTPELIERLQLQADVQGAFVAGVAAGSPAAQGGIQAGDVIIRFDGKDADDPTSLSLIIAGTEPGTEVNVEVVRQGKTQTLDVTVGQRPVRAMK